MKHLLPTLFVLVAAAAAAPGGEAGKPDVAALQRSADAGKADAQYELGMLVFKGIRAEYNPERLMDLWGKAAASGHLDAIFMLGEVYDEGVVAPRDRAKAVELWTKAADKGLAKAMTSLAYAYLNGRGVARDARKAAELYQRAADLGNATAQYNVAVNCLAGAIVPKDEKKALEMYAKSAEQGHVPAMYALGSMFYEAAKPVPGLDENKALRLLTEAAGRGSSWAQDMLMGGNAEGAKFKLAFWKEEAAGGNVYAMVQLGHYYRVPQTRGAKPDYDQAYTWYKAAADKGNAEGIFQVGLCYDWGWGVPKDFAKSNEWLRRATELDHGSAWNLLGVHYMQGSGMPRNMDEAVRCFTLAALRGHYRAANYLLDIYEKSGGPLVDPAKAALWFEKKMELEPAYNVVMEGNRYVRGTGRPKDPKRAWICYRLAADKGDETGMYNLGWCHESGTGVDRDLRNALDCYIKAADMGKKNAPEAIKRVRDNLEKTGGQQLAPPAEPF